MVVSYVEAGQFELSVICLALFTEGFGSVVVAGVDGDYAGAGYEQVVVTAPMPQVPPVTMAVRS